MNFYKTITICSFFSFALGLTNTPAFSQNIKGDSITIAVEPAYNNVSGIHRALFGENYRKIWATPVTMKVFYLSKEKGGMTVVGQGGGHQTRSLKLKDAEGNEWALRTVQKYPERALPKRLRKTIIKDILQDEVSTSHPFSALVVPPLAEALQVPHANPQIVYVPDDPALGKYSKEYANHVFLIEERDPLDVDKTDNTDKAEKKLEEDNDNRVQQKLVLRARLMDMVIGDWDRHEDQWRWAREKNDTGIVYTPIPRDRDKVFYTTSGLFPGFLSHQRLKEQLQPYTGDIRKVDGWNYNARYFDRYFLNQLSESDWKEQIADVQKTLTDDLIINAMKRMPPNIYRISAPAIIPAFKSRRDGLEKIALDYYRFLSQHVDIPATKKNEKFDIAEQQDGNVAVTISKIKKDGTLGRVMYQRTFEPAVTQDIRLYGLDGKDVYKVTGTTPSPIKVRMIGGVGVDSFYVDQQLHNKSNLYIYDKKGQVNSYPSHSDAKIRLAKDSTVNQFDRTSFKYDHDGTVLSFGFSPDEGIVAIGGIRIERQGFRKEPFASKQTLLAGYAFGRQSFQFNYSGDFRRIWGSNNNLGVNVVSKGPNNVANFFGIGNETFFNRSSDYGIRYYRNHFNTINADTRIYHDYNRWQLSAGFTGQIYYATPSPNINHYLNVYATQHPSEDVYNTKAYAGAIAGAQFDSRNSSTNPSKGILWNTTVNGVTGFGSSNNKYVQVLSELKFYINPDQDSVLIIANRIGGGTIFGKAGYFQQMKVGGPDNLRGYHTYRFTGKSSLYDNLEVRLKLFDFNAYLFPGTLGLLGFNDVGRVWVPGENSNKWHDGYGGGLFLIPTQKLILQALVGFSDEGTLPYLTIGYRF